MNKSKNLKIQNNNKKYLKIYFKEYLFGFNNK